MADIILFYSTAPDEATAGLIARKLVEAGAAACVNIFPGMKSVYRWRDGIEETNETALMIKAAGARAGDIRDLILSVHPYDCPALIAIPIDRASSLEAYCAWIENPH